MAQQINDDSSEYRAQLLLDAGFSQTQVKQILKLIPANLDQEIIRRKNLHRIWQLRRKFPKNKRFIRGW